MICTYCNGIGYTGIRNGDDAIDCETCNGTGETVSQLTLSEAIAICRAWNWGGRVPERLHNEALEVVALHMPPVPYVPPPEDDELLVEMIERNWDRLTEYWDWQREQDEYQDMLREN